jgi:hypothetical protein
VRAQRAGWPSGCSGSSSPVRPTSRWTRAAPGPARAPGRRCGLQFWWSPTAAPSRNCRRAPHDRPHRPGRSAVTAPEVTVRPTDLPT